MTSTKIEFLNKYTLSTDSVELLEDRDNLSELPIPDYWKRAFQEDSVEKRKSIIISEWEKYINKELSNTILYLKTYLQNVELMKIGDRFSLLYTLLSYQTGDICYYEGKVPLTEQELSSKLQRDKTNIDESILHFYTKIHDGFYYYPSKSLGLDSSDNIDSMADFEWEYEDELHFDLSSCYNFFSNGMGMYVVLDLNSSPDKGAYLWSTRELPIGDKNFWNLVDEWIIIGLDF